MKPTLNEKLRAFLITRPNRWLSMYELAEVAGVGGWRTRLSQCRMRYEMRIEWNHQSGSASRHRYVPPAPRDLIEVAERSTHAAG